MRIAIVLPTLFLSSLAHAICINPFGCQPKSLNECEAVAAREAKTEHAAKVLLSRCRANFPDVSESQCKADAHAWVEEMRTTAGTGARYQQLDSPRDSCKKWFPSFYQDDAWFSPQLCVEKIKEEIDSQKSRFRGNGSAIAFLGIPVVSPQCAAWVQPHINELCVEEQAAVSRCNVAKKNPLYQQKTCEISTICAR